MTMRAVYYVLMVLLILIGALLIVDGTRRGQQSRAAGRVMAPEMSPEAVTARSPISRTNAALPAASPASVQIDDQSSDTVAVQAGPLTSQRLTRDVQLSDVAEIAGSTLQPVLIFRDGSRLTVTADIRDQLPGDLQLRLNYTRDN